MKIYKCDRCKKEAPLMWTVTLSVENLNPMAQHIPPQTLEICTNCKHLLLDWIKDGPSKMERLSNG
jgi:hypothetical protein